VNIFFGILISYKIKEDGIEISQWENKINNGFFLFINTTTPYYLTINYLDNHQEVATTYLNFIGSFGYIILFYHIYKAKKLLKKDPFSGHLFLFINKRRTSCKCLYYDGTGLVIVAKRLEEGLFSRINLLYKKEVVLTQAEFSLFFEGANLEKRFIESPIEIKKVARKLKALNL
jgi:transposase